MGLPKLPDDAELGAWMDRLKEVFGDGPAELLTGLIADERSRREAAEQQVIATANQWLSCPRGLPVQWADRIRRALVAWISDPSPKLAGLVVDFDILENREVGGPPLQLLQLTMHAGAYHYRHVFDPETAHDWGIWQSFEVCHRGLIEELRK